MRNFDSALEDRVHSAIAGSPYLAGRNLRFEAQSGKVTLRGVVNTYFQKQMAQEALRKIDGVAAIENHLEVSWAQDAHEQPGLAARRPDVAAATLA